MPSQAVAQSSPLGMMPTGVPHTSAVYTVKATAQLLSCSEWFVRQLFYKGRIKCNKLPSGDIRIPASAIDKFLNDTETTYRPATEGIGVIAAERAKTRRRAKVAPRKVPPSSKTRTKIAA